jgi:hypothetical protein
MAVFASVGARAGRVIDVDRRFLGAALRCPLAVARDLGRYLRTALAVRRGEEILFDCLCPCGDWWAKACSM